MERKIGEIFEYNGEWYQCIVGNDCENCAFKERKCYTVVDNGDPIGDCCDDRRKDNKDVIFKNLEKVGEPYVAYGKVRQKYKLYIPLTITKGIIERDISCDDVHVIVDIENKQNKETMEDMEEKKQKLDDLVGLYTSAKITYKEFDEKLKTLYADKEECKSSLKEFDLEAAKAGTPVCTRDGRKARIICFDAQGNKPLIVLSKINGQEVILRYTKKGQSDNFHSPTPREDDLMMLPKKKEGWVNVDKRSNGDVIISKPYPTRDEAIHNSTELTIDTVNIEWEE